MGVAEINTLDHAKAYLQLFKCYKPLDTVGGVVFPNFKRQSVKKDAVLHAEIMIADINRLHTRTITKRNNFNESVSERIGAIRYFEEKILRLSEQGKDTVFLRKLMGSVTMDFLNLTLPRH